MVGTWLAMGSSLQLTAKTYFAHRWDAVVPLRVLEQLGALLTLLFMMRFGCSFLVAASLILGLLFWWKKNSDVHNAKFQSLGESSACPSDA